MYRISKVACSLFLSAIMLLAFTLPVFAENTTSGTSEPQYHGTCPEQGTLERVTIPIENAWLSGNMIDSEGAVYTPYGYDESKRYNFVLALTDFSTDLSIESSKALQDASEAYDWLIYNGSDPFIVLTLKVANTAAETQYRMLAYNVRMQYLPYMTEHYSLYAGKDLESQIKNRNHSAVFGTGEAALFAWYAVMRWNVDLFASCYLGSFNNTLRKGDVIKDINAEGKYLLNSLSCGCRATTARFRNVSDFYHSVVASCDSLEDKTNAYFFDLTDDKNADIISGFQTFFGGASQTVETADHYHAYKDNRCVICGKEPCFYEGNVPARYYFQCPEQGKVVSFKYKTRDWRTDGSKEVEKEGLAYLPYGYDESKRYNVMILLHGHTLDRHAFMDKAFGFDYGVKVQYHNDYDWFFYEKLCRPMIIVTLDTPPEAEHNFRDMQYEIRYDVLPYLADHFATYAKNGSEASLIAARDHFGLGGSSNGAGFTHGGSIYSNLAYFGSVIMAAGGMKYVEHADCLNRDKDQYKLNCLVRLCGTLDRNYEDVLKGYNHVAKHVDYLEKGKNLYFFSVRQDHNQRVEYTCFANAFQVLFPPVADDVDIVINAAAAEVIKGIRSMQ